VFNYIVWIVAGAVIGLITVLIMRDRSWLLNIVLGMVSAILSGYLLIPMIHLGTINQENFNTLGLLVSLGSAVALLAIVNSIRLYRNRDVPDDVLESKWIQVRNKIHTRWSRLTEEDIDKIDGKYDQFIGMLQERYGCAKEQAEDQLQGYLKAITRKSKSSFLYGRGGM